MDVHKYEIAAAICAAQAFMSKIVSTTIFSADADGMKQFWNYIKKYRPLGFAMEATGIYHHMPFEFLQQKQDAAKWEYKIVVVNPSDAAGLPGRPKYDKIDAQNLAIYLSKGLLTNGKPISKITENLKAIFRTAHRIERDRTALKNRIKKILDTAGIRPKRFNIETQWASHFLYHFIEHDGTLGSFLKEINSQNHPMYTYKRVLHKNMEYFTPYLSYSLNSVQKALIRHFLVELDFKTSSKILLSVEVEQLIAHHPGLRRDAYNLSTIPGISPFTATWILAEIGNINQFTNRRKFASYCGCCPRVVSSAGKVYSAHTNKHSNKYLRTIFYQAAMVLAYFTKKPSVLKEYAECILSRKRGNSSKYALSIIAAKINKIVFAILRDKTPFSPEIIKEQLLQKDLEPQNDFSIVERRLLRIARNSLERVSNMEKADKLGLLGDEARTLAEEFSLILQGKN